MVCNSVKVSWGSMVTRALVVAVCIVCCQSSPTLEEVQAQAKPNIVWIMADDLGVGDVSVYPSPASARLETPNIARLAEEGMKFTDAYAGYSVCAPSRWTLMTGYHTGHGNVSNGGPPLLLKNQKSVATILKDAGYTCAIEGKWALDGNYNDPQPPSFGFPTLRGFDYYYGQSDQTQCHNYYPAWMYRGEQNITVNQNLNADPESCGADAKSCLWSGDAWTQDAVTFLKNHTNTSSTPFFLYLAYTAPHAGAIGSTQENDVPGPDVSSGPYANQTQWPKVERDFANTVYQLDKRIGTILDTLDSLGLSNNTVVFFASDNGAHNEGGHDYQFFNSSGYLNGFKRSIHDGGHRSAFIARWPGVIAANTTSRQLFAFYDFLPTAAELAGVPRSELPPRIDGRSIAQTLRTGKESQPEFVYHEYADCLDPVCTKHSALNCEFGQNIRMGNWSGVCVGPHKPCTGAPPGQFFLYDMSVDDGQRNDVSFQHPAIVSSILDIMAKQYNKTVSG
eukprot:m.105623 g.105623  ORF g.105623 m.105623 type:complete len:506 (+) comp13283_c0_seq3:337-1854(+)